MLPSALIFLHLMEYTYYHIKPIFRNVSALAFRKRAPTWRKLKSIHCRLLRTSLTWISVAVRATSILWTTYRPLSTLRLFLVQPPRPTSFERAEGFWDCAG